MGQKTLIIITNNYPLGGRTEEAFLKDEIPILASSFHKVLFLPLWKDADCFDLTFWPTNVAYDDGLTKQFRERGKFRYLKFLNPTFFRLFIQEKRTIKNRLQLEYLIRTFIEGEAIKTYFENQISNGQISLTDTVIYSFWFADGAIGLGLLPKRILPRWVSRAHGYDLYDERVPIRSRVLRNKSFANVEKVLCCSNQGAEYLASRYPIWKKKIDSLYLGTPKPIRTPKYETKTNVIRFITIARIEPVKRPLMTFDILCALANEYPNYSIIWTVVGDGSLMSQLRNAVSTMDIPNMQINLLGEQTNSFVHEMFEVQTFDWMIMLSESEGLPVSIAEAMSYGIPSIATDVGGVKEEVKPSISGILLPANPTIHDLLKEIDPYLTNTSLYSNLRESTKSLWGEKFDSDKLKQRLARILLNIA